MPEVTHSRRPRGSLPPSFLESHPKDDVISFISSKYHVNSLDRLQSPASGGCLPEREDCIGLQPAHPRKIVLRVLPLSGCLRVYRARLADIFQRGLRLRAAPCDSA